jgi:hypothetical protein
VQTGQVTAPAPVTLTMTIDGQSTSIQFTVQPLSLKSFDLCSHTDRPRRQNT